MADALRRFDAGALAPEDLRELLRGMTCTASALTRILDQLRESPGLGEHELGPSAHRHLRSELDQAAAAAEDLQVTSESLVRLVPQEVLVPAPARMP
ncbi:hypothetical protein FPZ12_035935 [Amycolatopsis acidicola]|uniref:Uncharacterized protein n=1 Tax=Amycolatopsis acidicola TaxID=2596893 RepID=A0A5N0UQP1_9PSEU|nr:hypothetical protein FPZ12_035935 [Amycolatopsis acidicola]